MSELELIEQVKLGQKAWQDLCDDNKHLVLSQAKRYARSGEVLDYLIDAGNKGLLVAATKYDTGRGFKFCAYAIWFVRKAIEKAFAEKMAKDDLAITEYGVLLSDREVQMLKAHFYGEPSLEELRNQLSLTPERFDHILNKALLKLGLTK